MTRIQRTYSSQRGRALSATRAFEIWSVRFKLISITLVLCCGNLLVAVDDACVGRLECALVSLRKVEILGGLSGRGIISVESDKEYIQLDSSGRCEYFPDK